jgi:hypothetical protein
MAFGRCGLLLAGLTLVLGCGRGSAVEAGARRAFSAQHSCPDGRITVRLRPDLTEGALEARRRRQVADPPESLKANPELYAKVKAAKEQERQILEELSARPADRKPPADVAADPARLAIWRAQRGKEQARQDRWDREHPVVEARGCDRTELYVCTLAGRRYWCAPSGASP